MYTSACSDRPALWTQTDLDKQLHERKPMICPASAMHAEATTSVNEGSTVIYTAINKFARKRKENPRASHKTPACSCATPTSFAPSHLVRSFPKSATVREQQSASRAARSSSRRTDHPHTRYRQIHGRAVAAHVHEEGRMGALVMAPQAGEQLRSCCSDGGRAGRWFHSSDAEKTACDAAGSLTHACCSSVLVLRSIDGYPGSSGDREGTSVLYQPEAPHHVPLVHHTGEFKCPESIALRYGKPVHETDARAHLLPCVYDRSLASCTRWRRSSRP